MSTLPTNTSPRCPVPTRRSSLAGWGGYNDRFAAVCASRAAVYGERIDGAAQFASRVADDGVLHAEQFLKHRIVSSGMRAVYLDMKLALVRPDGSTFHA
mgnify:CR=1 FL=1